MKRTDRKKNSLHLPVAAVFIFILSLSVFADEIEHADVENAIILKNITMESDEFLKDPDMLDGQIIIDHEFDDELRELKKGPDVKSKPSNKKGRHISNNIRNKEQISLIFQIIPILTFVCLIIRRVTPVLVYVSAPVSVIPRYSVK